MALAFITSARRLRPYFHSHTIVVLTNQPLRKILQNAEALGRFVNWSVELGERLFSTCNSGAGLILISPEKFFIEYALRFDFQASNDEAKYEVLLTRIRQAHALKVVSLSVYSDSQLVVNHVLGEYEAKDDRLIQYLQLVKTLASKFKNFTICQISRQMHYQGLPRYMSQNFRTEYTLSSLRSEALAPRLMSMWWNKNTVGRILWENYIVKELKHAISESKPPDMP
ncbi:hypothetical protein RJ639_000805 [Escallonia herrerae]|uniref:RNase H type-1 domain-containing protein n=1 Tax=Escallonia herrerae TaxID=1293975 RepID=A0AA88XA52_9ASTE|nr:hypothetical protein RJ639_000805 [Escallonia herrerae]